MFLFLDYYNLSLFLGGLVALLSGAAVYFNDHRKIENKTWMLLNISTAVWSFGYFRMITSTSTNDALFANWILHAGAIFIPLFYLFFITTLTQTTNKHRGTLITLLLVAFYFLYQNTSQVFVRGVFSKGPFDFAPDAGPLYIYFTLYFFAVVLYAFTILEEKIKTAEKQETIKLRYVLYSSLAGFVGGGFVFFLTFNIPMPPYPIVLFTFYPLIIAYAMLKHKLFDVKIAATEILLGSVWVGLLFFTLLEENIGKQIVFGIIFTSIVVLGIILIHLLYKDVEHREQVEKLASELEESNKRQKNLLHEINHDVKEMLTEATGAFANLLDGDYGVLPTEARVLCEAAFKKVRAGTRRVMDFLHATNLEKGTVQFEMKSFNLRQTLEKVVKDNEDAAKEKGLDLVMRVEDGDYPFTGDENQLALHVFDNLLKNAIIFTPKGGVVVSLSKRYGKIMVAMKDTGVGITEEDKKNLFTSGGHGKDSMKINVHSTGNGLFIAKSTVLAHGGKIWAESAGASKGAAFFVELPSVTN